MTGLIDYRNVSIFRKKVEILKDINLLISSGEFIFLTGNVGTGKTSLIKSIYADVAIASGYAEVSGYKLTEIERREIPYLRRKLGIIFQDYQLLSDRSVYDNLKFVLEAAEISDRKEIKNRIMDTIAQVDLSGKEAKMPHELSGGEQQRAVIARAIVNRPEIILADEPTGNLDPESSIKIMEILQGTLKTGSCVLMATHNYELLDKYPNTTYNIENKELKLVR